MNDWAFRRNGVYGDGETGYLCLSRLFGGRIPTGLQYLLIGYHNSIVNAIHVQYHILLVLW
jgi:hypothetical protein